MTTRALLQAHKRTALMFCRRRDARGIQLSPPRGRRDGGVRSTEGRHRRHMSLNASSTGGTASSAAAEGRHRSPHRSKLTLINISPLLMKTAHAHINIPFFNLKLDFSLPYMKGHYDKTASVPDSGSPRICILGGGFGGLYTAVKLDGLMWPKGNKPEVILSVTSFLLMSAQVTLIDQNARFVFKPLLYEILTGTAEDFEVAPFFNDLLEPFQTQFVQARVEGVDVSSESNEGGTVLLDDGRKIHYDWLVIAIGARSNFYGIPGIKEHAIPFNSFEDVQRIVAALKDMTGRRGHAVVVGGGYAGVELAASVAAKIKRLHRGQSNRSVIDVTLITDTDTILPAAPLSQRLSAEDQLNKANIQVKTGYLVKGIQEKVDGDRSMKVIQLITAGSREEAGSMEVDVAMWTAGSTPSTRSEASNQTFPFERTNFGALRTESTMRLVQQKRVFALGDDAVIDDPKSEIDRLPATAQVALQQADYVAWNLWAGINHRPLIPFRYQHLGDMMSLGSSNAAIALPFSLPKPLTDAIRDSPLYRIADFVGLELGEGDVARDRRLTVEGPIAAVLRRLAYWYRQPTNEHKAKIARDYFQKITRLLSAQSQT